MKKVHIIGASFSARCIGPGGGLRVWAKRNPPEPCPSETEKMQSAAPTAVPAPNAAAAVPARWWPKRTLGVVLPLVAFFVAASMLFVDPPTAPGRHPFSWFAGSGAPSLRGIPATHRPSAPLPPKPPPDTSREESSFLDRVRQDRVRQHEEQTLASQSERQSEQHSSAVQRDVTPVKPVKPVTPAKPDGVCGSGKKVQRLYIGLDIGGEGTRAIPLLQCDGAPDALLAVPDKYSKKSDDMVVHVCKNSAALHKNELTTLDTNKCAGLARELIRGPLVKVTNDMASSFPDAGVNVTVFGYATSGARTLPSAKKTLESLDAFKRDALEAFLAKRDHPLQDGSWKLSRQVAEEMKWKGDGKNNSFTLIDFRVLHGWEEAHLELMLASRVAADAVADATAAGAGGATPATAADWKETNMISFGSASAQMAIRIDGDESKQPSSALLERWVRDYDAAKTAKIETIAGFVKTIATQFGQPDQQGDDRFLACGASEKHFDDYIHILEHDSAPAPQQGHAAASSALLQVQSGARPGAHLLVSFLSSTNENCAPQHFGAVTAEVGEDHQIGEVRDGPPCRARDLASPEDSRHKGYSHLAGGLHGVMHTFERWARKCLQSETQESKKTDDLKKLLCSCGFGGKEARKQLMASDPCEGMDIMGDEIQISDPAKKKIFLQYGGDGGQVVYRALLRILGFGDGQPGAACGPRGEDTQDIMQESSVSGGTSEKGSTGGTASATFAAGDTGNVAAASEKTDISFHTVLNGGGNGKTKLLVSGQSCLAVRDPREKHDMMGWVPSLTVGLPETATTTAEETEGASVGVYVAVAVLVLGLLGGGAFVFVNQGAGGVEAMAGAEGAEGEAAPDGEEGNGADENEFEE
eukprot:g12119.t1